MRFIASFPFGDLCHSPGGLIQMFTMSRVPSGSRGVFDEKTKGKMVFYRRFLWKVKVWKAVILIIIVRTCDVVKIWVRPPAEVSIRVWFFEFVMLKGRFHAPLIHFILWIVTKGNVCFHQLSQALISSAHDVTACYQGKCGLGSKVKC